jgi:polyisoprenoid-binding protein YceI
MKKAILLFLIISLSLSGKAQNQTWNIVSSTISFKIKNAGFTVNGSFKGLDGTIEFDPAKNTGNKIEVSIDAKTIETGINLRDEHLRKEDYFSADKFPKISMRANAFTKTADGKFSALFTLSLKGTSTTLPLLFSFSGQDGKAIFTGTFKINRLDYHIGSSSIIMSDDVTISIELNCLKK